MSLKASFVPPRGFHPVLHLSTPRTPSPDPSCSLYTLISLPPPFIADRYQLSQLHGEGKLGLEDGILEVIGEGDLEAAVWKAKEARVLIELARNDEEDNGTTEIGVKVPLHMRYQVPDQKRRRRKRDEVQDGRIGKVQVRMDYPRVFWACQERTWMVYFSRVETMLNRRQSTYRPARRRTKTFRNSLSPLFSVSRLLIPNTIKCDTLLHRFSYILFTSYRSAATQYRITIRNRI